ncbi:hypothetical protein IIA95_01125 [Patescibacteria group bacterium]|nr:hypothetical protein [Patescibacteria group bacterium]
MIEFFVGEARQNDAAVALRWCVGREALQELKKREAKNPHLLLFVFKDGKEQQRLLIPLEQMMHYVFFNHPGTHDLCGSIVWDNSGDRFELQKNVFHHYTKLCDIDSDNPFLLNCNLEMRGLNEFGRLKISVDERFFAENPPQWEQGWVNFWYETAPRDQCQYRRRRFVAYSIQPPVLLAFVFILVIARLSAMFWFLLLGRKGIGFRAIFRPFKFRTKEIWAYSEGSVYADIFSGPLDRIAELAIKITRWSSNARLEKRRQRQKARIERREERRQREEQQRRRALDEFYNEELRELVCEGVPLKADVRALPEKRRTIYLRLQAFKAEVCRPFAR